MGRPLGTERSPTDPLSRHLIRQTEARMPVERLARKEGAGGRRRADREDRPRGRHGLRPEEVRAERREAERPTRRQNEAKGRERSGAATRREDPSTSTAERTPRPDAAPKGIRFAENVRASARREARGAPANSRATTNPNDAAAAETGVPASPPGVSLAPAGRVPAGATQPSTTAAIAGGATASRPGAAALTPPAGPVRPETGPANEVRPKGEAADPAPAARWSETAEAERASAVLRQFRLQIHPGLRTANLQLSPPELGRISIRLSVRDARVRAAVRAESPETLQILERHLPELEASFAQRGLEIDEFELDLGFDEPGGSGADGGEGASGAASDPVRPEMDASIDHARLARALARGAGVDTYA